MNKVYAITLLISLLLVTFAHTEAGGDMMGGQQGHVKGMVHGHEVVGSMMEHMNHLGEIMQNMSRMMEKHMDQNSMRKMSGFMKEMSVQMNNMSGMMEKGEASQQEMLELNQQMSQTQKNFDLMQLW
jgi:hypothetical protein